VCGVARDRDRLGGRPRKVLGRLRRATHSSCSSSDEPTRRISPTSLGKMPTMWVRRPISRLTALERAGAAEFAPVHAWERVEAEQIGLGVQDELRDLGRDRLETLDHLGESLARLLAGGGAEAPADRGRDHRLLARGAVTEHVSEEVHGATLPRAAEDDEQRGMALTVGNLLERRPADTDRRASSPRCMDRRLPRACQANPPVRRRARQPRGFPAPRSARLTEPTSAASS
jgi:hypothetical protein